MPKEWLFQMISKCKSVKPEKIACNIVTVIFNVKYVLTFYYVYDVIKITLS